MRGGSSLIPSSSAPLTRRVVVGEVAPALVRALGSRRAGQQVPGADDVDAAVDAIVEAQDHLPRDNAMLDDPVKRAAN